MAQGRATAPGERQTREAEQVRDTGRVANGGTGILTPSTEAMAPEVARRTWPLVCLSAAFTLAAGFSVLVWSSERPGSRRQEPKCLPLNLRPRVTVQASRRASTQLSRDKGWSNPHMSGARVLRSTRIDGAAAAPHNP